MTVEWSSDSDIFSHFVPDLKGQIMERSRQSARECRARKKLRYQYLDELVLDREEAVGKLQEELQRLELWSQQLDQGIVPVEIQQWIQRGAASTVVPNQNIPLLSEPRPDQQQPPFDVTTVDIFDTQTPLDYPLQYFEDMPFMDYNQPSTYPGQNSSSTYPQFP